MAVQKVGEGVQIASFQLKAHQNGDGLHSFQGVDGFGPSAQIAAHHVAKQVSGKASLSGVDQGKALLKLLRRLRRNGDLLHVDLLMDAGAGGNELDPRRQAAHLILPAAARAHDLLHGQHDGIDFVVGGLSSQKTEQALHAGAGKNAAGAEAGALRNPHHSGGQADAAAQTGADFRKGLLRSFAERNDAAGDQRRLMQGEGIVGVMAVLNLLHAVRPAGYADIRAGKFHMGFRKPFHPDLDRINAVQLQRGVQHRAALFVAVGRGVRPAAAPVNPDRKLHIHPVPGNAVILYGGQPGCRVVENGLLNGVKAEGFHPVISRAVKGKAVLLHILRQGVIDPDLQRKTGISRVFHKKGENFPVNAVGSECLQRVPVISARLQRPDKTAGQDPVFQLPLPGSRRKSVRAVEAGLQTQPFAGPPGFLFFLGSFPAGHFCGQKGQSDRRLHVGRGRIQAGVPQGALLPFLPEF